MGSCICPIGIGAPSNSRWYKDISQEMGSLSHVDSATHHFHHRLSLRQLLFPLLQPPSSPLLAAKLFPLPTSFPYGWPPVPLAAVTSSLLAELTRPASSGPGDHTTLFRLVDPSAPRRDHAGQSLAALSQQMALAIQQEVATSVHWEAATSKRLDHSEAELRWGEGSGSITESCCGSESTDSGFSFRPDWPKLLLLIWIGCMALACGTLCHQGC